MTVGSRKFVAVVGGIAFCALWVVVIATLGWLLLDPYAMSVGQVPPSFGTRVTAFLIVSSIPAYWLYAGGTGVLEDYREYKTIDNRLGGGSHQGRAQERGHDTAAVLSPGAVISEDEAAQRLGQVLAEVKLLAAEYYRLTGKPLGVTGEVAEYIAAERLGLELAPPRTTGYDAFRRTEIGIERIQIKGRAYGEDAKPGQRLGTIKRGAPCDKVLLVLLDNRTLEPREMWEASYAAVEERLSVPGSRARARGALSVREFKRLARPIWPGSSTQV